MNFSAAGAACAAAPPPWPAPSPFWPPPPGPAFGAFSGEVPCCGTVGAVGCRRHQDRCPYHQRSAPRLLDPHRRPCPRASWRCRPLRRPCPRRCHPRPCPLRRPCRRREARRRVVALPGRPWAGHRPHPAGSVPTDRRASRADRIGVCRRTRCPRPRPTCGIRPSSSLWTGRPARSAGASSWDACRSGRTASTGCCGCSGRG